MGPINKTISFLKKSRQGVVDIIQLIKLLWNIEPRILFVVFFVNILLGAIFAPLSYLNKLIIDKIIKNVGNPEWQSAIEFLALLIFLRIFLEIVRDVLHWVSRYSRFYLDRRFDAYLVYLLAEKKSYLDALTIENPVFKDRYNKLERNVSQKTWALMYYLISFPENFSGFFTSLIILMNFRPILILIIMIMVIPQFLAERSYVKKEYKLDDEISNKYRVLNTYFSPLSASRSFMEVRILDIVPHFLKRISEIKKEIYDEETKIYKQREKVSFLYSLPQNIFYFSLEIYLVIQTIFQRITVGTLQFYLSTANSFRYSLSALISGLNELYENYLYVKEIKWLMELKPQIVSGVQKFPDKVESIEFKDIWFKYKEDQSWVLKGINLRIKGSEDIAIVGENGAGKSTLIKLLCRFYDPQKGQILINGIDIKEIDRNLFWKNLGVLFQTFELFPLTARTSIAYGRVDKFDEMEAIQNAAKKSVIHDYIQGLPLQYENPLEPGFEKGVDPSIGQWQRIGLARVFMRNPAIMILDEPTSNVDPKSEEEIFQRVLEEGKKKNLILISHRFSTVRKADKIAVMDKGKIVEFGTHEQLMKEKGMYEELFSLQAKAYK